MARDDEAAASMTPVQAPVVEGDAGRHAPQRCGFVAVLGAPNVGKSTLVNRMVGTKVSIVSPKVQTTRSRVLGIALQGESQIVLIDTPGLFQPRRRLDKAMVSAAWDGALGADIVALVVDSVRGAEQGAASVAEWLQHNRRHAVLVLNKVDAVDKRRLLAAAQALNASSVFSQTFMVSALTGDGVDDLVRWLAGEVPVGPWLFPEDQVSDLPLLMLAAEITREKLFVQLHEELPYAVAVETESWTPRDDGSIAIEQFIYVERDSQRPIVLGRGGAMIKRIGAQARHELESILEARVHLFLTVKVREKWREDPVFLRLYGLEPQAGARRTGSCVQRTRP